MLTRIDFDVTCLILQHSFKLQLLALVDYYCQQQLNEERIDLQQVVTARFIGQPQSKCRDGSNKNYLATKMLFSGYNWWNVLEQGDCAQSKDDTKSLLRHHYQYPKSCFLRIRMMATSSKNSVRSHHYEENNNRNSKFLTFSTLTTVLPE